MKKEIKVEGVNESLNTESLDINSVKEDLAEAISEVHTLKEDMEDLSDVDVTDDAVEEVVKTEVEEAVKEAVEEKAAIESEFDSLDLDSETYTDDEIKIEHEEDLRDLDKSERVKEFEAKAKEFEEKAKKGLKHIVELSKPYVAEAVAESKKAAEKAKAYYDEKAPLVKENVKAFVDEKTPVIKENIKTLAKETVDTSKKATEAVNDYLHSLKKDQDKTKDTNGFDDLDKEDDGSTLADLITSVFGKDDEDLDLSDEDLGEEGYDDCGQDCDSCGACCGYDSDSDFDSDELPDDLPGDMRDMLEQDSEDYDSDGDLEDEEYGCLRGKIGTCPKGCDCYACDELFSCDSGDCICAMCPEDDCEGCDLDDCCKCKKDELESKLETLVEKAGEALIKHKKLVATCVVGTGVFIGTVLVRKAIKRV